MKHKKFEIIMIKNTLAMMLPIMVLLLVLIFVGVRYSLFYAVQCYELTKIEPIEDQIAHYKCPVQCGESVLHGI